MKRTLIVKQTASGGAYLREGVTVAFFVPMPFDKACAALGDAFDALRAMFPPDFPQWESVGASSEEWKPANKSTLDRCRAQLKPEAARKRSLTSFELTGGGGAGDAPVWGILIIGNPKDPDLPDELNLFQAYFPADVLDENRLEPFVEGVCAIARTIPLVSGYVSPGLHWSELHSSAAMRDARGIASRYPGFDVQDNANARTDLGARVRGARWITFLGEKLVKELGGAGALRESLRREITVSPLNNVIMLRAGPTPELGDRNARIDTPLLREVARVLEPITAFDEPAMIGRQFGSDDDDFLRRWERRFLD